MPSAIRLVGGKQIDYDAAIASESDVLAQHQQWNDSLAFKVDLWHQSAALESLVAFHVGVDAACLKIGHPKTWSQGSFNVAIPMLLFDDAGAAEGWTSSPSEHENGSLKRVVLRCPSRYYAGMIDEKMRCETASYVWMQRHCPHVRIPHLYGFGFPGGAHPPTCPIETGYMVLEHFGPSFGKQLPLVVRNHKLSLEPVKMRNLFRGVARIILAVARIPLAKVGAFRFRDDGTIALENRPITSDVFRFENEGAPRTVDADKTYTNVDQYVADLAAFHDQRFLHTPNAAFNAADCYDQMAVNTFLRAVTPTFITDYRDGPFALFISDQNATNIMVDDEWNVTGIFDLEWMIAAPVDVPRTPYWLTWDSLDQIAGEGYGEYKETRDVFMDVFKAEEALMDTSALQAALGGSTLSSVMERSWDTKRDWFYLSLFTVAGLHLIVQRQIVPLFYPDGLPYSNPAEACQTR
ncbi:hypothetical protein SPI_03762 [Niveomyces insectorum RCEF 264]|uniref:Aminoglycoside phosphotransferase n=1 Tax=Niveomyces insectorum RCEF 264 TaxID=1081102 RepID=A0A167WC38_9HYPO|nr:hypothetical protein SPI_03762 [Niveomyces insectorum RCEF 264]